MNKVNKPERLNLLWIPKDNKGCGFYRMLVPANEIKKQDLANVVVNFGWDWKMVEWAHIIIIQRMTDIEAYEAIDRAHSLGKKVIYELDDLIQCVSPTNPCFDFWSPFGPNLGRCLKIIQKCDAMQVTTERMQKEYSLWNPRTEVLPNYLDKTLWDMPAWKASHWDAFYKKKNDGIIRIGWAGAACYDTETEILTEDGFKYFKDLGKNEKVATLNPQTQEVEYQKPLNYFEYQYDGKMLNIEMQQVSLCVTPNHNIYQAKKGALKSNLKYNLIKAEELDNKAFYLKRNAKWVGKDKKYWVIPSQLTPYSDNRKPKIHPEIKFEIDDWMKFFGFWLAEGWTSKTKYKGWKSKKYPLMQVGLANQSKKLLLEIGNILDKYQIKYRIRKDYSQLIISDKTLWRYLFKFGGAIEKYIPKDVLILPSERLKLLLDYFIKGDGHIDKNGRIRAWTSSKRLADNLVELALKIGWGANVNNRGKTVGGKINGRIIKARVNNYQVNFLRDGKLSYLKPFVKKQHQEWIDYKGKVSCVEVKNGIIYIRRNGKSIWCGNSHYEDLQLIEQVITKICQKYQNVHFCLMGYHGESKRGPNLFQNIPPITSICPNCKHGGQLEKISGIELLYYPSKLKECAFDIAIAPLIETGFNQCKSDIKIKEYAALGIPVIATRVKPYSESVKEGYTGFLANTGKEWFDSLELLIKDKDLRLRLGKNNYRWYKENTIDKNIQKWMAFYNRVISFKYKW